MSLTEDMAGRKTRIENEKVRHKRMATIDEKIEKLKLKFLTLQNNNQHFKEQIAKYQEQIETNDKQIETLKAEKAKLVKYQQELAEMKVEVESVEELKKEKQSLEIELKTLKNELQATNKKVASLTEEFDV